MRHPLRPLWAPAVLAALAFSADPAARQYTLTPAERARQAVIDFTALDEAGNAITNLTPSDLTLRIDGRTRAIRSLEWIATGTAPALVPPPYGANTGTATTRTVLLIVDDETLKPGREQALRSEVRTFVQALGPADRVALVTVPYGGMKSDFTSDHAQLFTALDAITGRAPQTESTQDAGCRTRSTLIAIGSTLESIAATDAPLTVVLFAGALSPAQGVTTLSRQAGDVAGVTYMNTVGACEVLPDHYQQIAEAAARARAQMFVVQPDVASDPGGRVGLEHLTGLTGGPLWNLHSTSDKAMPRILAQTGGYYAARIDRDPNESPDQVRGVSVSVTRPGVTVRHRPRLVLRTSTPVPAGTTLLDLMRSTTTVSDLPLRAAATTSRHTDGQVKLLVQIDAPDDATLGAAMVSLFDETGRMVVNNSATPSELRGRSGLLAVAAPEGRYRLRLAASDTANPARLGTVDLPVEVGLVPAGPLRMSGLVLGQARPEGFTPRLEFSNDLSGVGMIELYGGKAGMQVGVAFEVARTTGGPPLATMPGALSPTSEPDKFVVTATIPVGALPPGDYEVRALVAVGDTVGRVTRTLRKVPPQ